MPPPSPEAVEEHEAQARSHQEKIQDQLAEDLRKKRGLTFKQEWAEIVENRPPFMNKFDIDIDPQKILDEGSRVERAMNPPIHARNLEEARAMAKAQGFCQDLTQEVLDTLPKAERDAYINWKKRVDSYWRRYKHAHPDYWPRGDIAGTRG
jgi:hypothetical protein